MSLFTIVSDSTADLPKAYYEEHQVKVSPLKFIIDGVTYGTTQLIEDKEFYRLMREEGKMPTTSQVNPQEARTVLEEALKENENILYIAFSSGLSGTYNSVRLAAEELSDEYPNANIVVMDSLCASMGQGLFVHYAVKLRDEGKTLSQTVDWLESHKQNLVHIFTVDDLNHLYRGGRVSKTTAIIGTLAGIKPILHVDYEGHLIGLKNVRGRKKSIITLVDEMEEKMGSFIDKNSDIFISHGDCEEELELLKSEIEKRFGKKNFVVSMVGPVIGSHSGPGTIALFFLGEAR